MEKPLISDEFTSTSRDTNTDEPQKVDAQHPLSESWRAEPLSLEDKSKVLTIKGACKLDDFSALCTHAGTDNGFVEDEVRRQVWPILLGSSGKASSDQEWKALPPHQDEHQVTLDVDRAFVYYPSHETTAQLAHRRAALTELIVSVLRTHPTLNYFQGYHDIAQVLLLVLGLAAAKPALARLSLLRIRDFMLPTIAGTRAHLDLIPAILYAADPQLCARLAGLQSFFALSATLTMFAHDVESYGGIARLFDYILARDAAQGVYLFAALVLLRRPELLDVPADEPEMLYAVLSKLPRPLDLESLVFRAEELRAQFPPRSLPRRAWTSISRASVLKTTFPLEQLPQQTLQQGEAWLDVRAKELEAEEARRAAVLRMRKMAMKYRRPASAIVLAVFVGVLSVWLGRGGRLMATDDIMGLAQSMQRRILDSAARILGWRL